MSDMMTSDGEVWDENLTAEYDETISNEDKLNNLLKLTSDSYTREIKRIKVREIGFTDPVKKGRAETMTGLTAVIKDLGVLDPIDVMTVEDPDDDFKYILISGLRRVYGALKNGIEEVDAVVWDFKDKDRGSDLALYLGLLLNRHQRRNYGEIWHLYQVLELQSAITPGTLEFLLEMESGDAMKLKDVMLCDYEEVKQALLSGEKTLDGAYKLLSKLRKEEDRLAMEDATGVADAVDGVDEITSDNTGEGGQLSDQDVLELLEMVDSMDEDVTDADFNDLNQGVVDSQAGGERHPLDPALKSAVLSRDNFKCKCCGFGGAAALGILAIHHILPCHTFAKGQPTDYMENLTTLCLNHHILLHVAERNGGKLQMTKEEFDSYSEEEQLALKKCLKLAKVAVEADKRKNMSLEDVRKATTDSIRHPMPGTGLKDAQIAYNAAKND